MRVLFLLLIGSAITFVQAQTNHPTWGLKYELIKPNGVVDSLAYLLATLENKTDTTLILVTGRKTSIPKRTFCRVEYQMKDGTISYSNQFPLYYEDYKGVHVIQPREKVEQEASLYKFIVYGEPHNGAFLTMNFYRKVAKIRLRLEGVLYHKKGVAYIGRIPLLVSDWIDVTGSDFEATMQEYLEKRKILNE